MTRLGSLLTQAAEDAPVGFDVTDVRRRVGRRRNLRRMIGGSAAVLVAAASISLVLSVDESDDRIEALGGAADEITLIGRWTPIAYSEVTVGADGAFLEFDGNGGFIGFNGCNGFSGTWRLDDDDLETGDIMVNANACPPTTVIAPITTLLDDRPAVSRFDDQPNTLQLSSPSGFIAFERDIDTTAPADSSPDGTGLGAGDDMTTGPEEERDEATHAAIALVETADRFVAFAAGEDLARPEQVPLADRVQIGLGDELRAELAGADRVDRSAWPLELKGFRARSGPVSLLDLLRDRDATALVGDHAGCAGIPSPRPVALAGLERVSLQPVVTGSCLEWFAVDLFIESSGRVAAVTLDLYEP